MKGKAGVITVHICLRSWLLTINLLLFQAVGAKTWGYTYACFRDFGGPRGWLAIFEGGNSRDKGPNRRNKGEISQGGQCGHFWGMYILQEMTMGVTKLDNSLVEISQDMELVVRSYRVAKRSFVVK